jgi:hypothetical protein
MMFSEIVIREGRYAPGKLISPKTEVGFWTPVTKDAAGNQTGSLEIADVVEMRFTKPAAAQKFHLVVRGQVGADGVGAEWTIVTPTERMGILYVPQGFNAEQSIMGAVYRLSSPRNMRILLDQMADMPGLNFTLQLL